MKKIAFIAGILIIPGFLNPAAAHFRFEGLLPFSEDYCSGLSHEPQAELSAQIESLPPSYGPQPMAVPWVAYGCKDANGKIITRGAVIPADEVKHERKTE